MIIILGLIILLTISLMLWVIRFDYYSIRCLIGAVCSVFISIILIVCSILITIDNCTVENTLAKKAEEKNAIEYRLKQIDTNDKNLLVNGGVYSDIVEYNKKIHDYKYYGSNLFTNWFIPYKLTQLDYISLPDGSK